MYICIICSQLVGRPVCRNKIFGLHTSGRRVLPAQTHVQPRCSRTQMPCGSPIAHSRQDALVYACCCNGGRQELTCLFATALTLPITALTHIPLPSFFCLCGCKIFTLPATFLSFPLLSFLVTFPYYASASLHHLLVLPRLSLSPLFLLRARHRRACQVP